MECPAISTLAPSSWLLARLRAYTEPERLNGPRSQHRHVLTLSKVLYRPHDASGSTPKLPGCRGRSFRLHLLQLEVHQHVVQTTRQKESTYSTWTQKWQRVSLWGSRRKPVGKRGSPKGYVTIGSLTTVPQAVATHIEIELLSESPGSGEATM